MVMMMMVGGSPFETRAPATSPSLAHSVDTATGVPDAALAPVSFLLEPSIHRCRDAVQTGFVPLPDAAQLTLRIPTHACVQK